MFLPRIFVPSLFRATLCASAALAFLSFVTRVFAQEPPAATEPADGAAADNSSAEIAATGDAVDGLSAYDDLMRSLMAKWKIPGGSIAIAKDGKLVFARGYGFADREEKRLVAPDALFRIASISKPITAVAVLRLVEQGKINLDERALPAIGPLEGPPGAKVDPRLDTITVRQLLQHTGGWDRDKSFDAMFIPQQAARGVGAPSPAEATTVIRYMQGVPLDFDPGTRYAYSNLGYAILGRLIERRTGKPYGIAVEQEVLRPAGISRMKLGRTLPEFRAEDEVHYYNFDEDDRTRCVFPYVRGRVQWPDGGFYVEAMDAHGGWIASAVDLVRFACAVDNRGRSRGKPLLAPASLAAMTARPGADFAKGKDVWYGLGWQVRKDGEDANWWHTGSLPGTSTLLVRAHNGMVWAVLFNTRPKESGLSREVDAACWEAAAKIEKWPEHDLFEKFE
jgi:CubicO group peptidase (beta-lactamase class C family)